MNKDLKQHPFLTRIPTSAPASGRSDATPVSDIYDRLLSGAVLPAFVLREAGLIDRQPAPLTRYHD